MLSAFSQWKQWPSYELEYRLGLLVRSEGLVAVDHRSQPVLCALFEDPQPSLACKHLLARLLIQHGRNDSLLPSHKTLIKVLRDVLAQGLDPLPPLELLNAKHGHFTNPDLALELVPLLIQVLNKSVENCQSSQAKAQAAMLAQDLIAEFKNEDFMIAQGMAEALARTLCRWPCFYAASALTSLCRLRSARQKVIDSLPAFLPSLFASFKNTAATLAIQFLRVTSQRRVVWRCLSGSLYESLDNSNVRDILRMLAADPEAAAHMVRHKVHNVVKLL